MGNSKFWAIITTALSLNHNVGIGGNKKYLFITEKQGASVDPVDSTSQTYWVYFTPSPLLLPPLSHHHTHHPKDCNSFPPRFPAPALMPLQHSLFVAAGMFLDKANSVVTLLNILQRPHNAFRIKSKQLCIAFNFQWWLPLPSKLFSAQGSLYVPCFVMLKIFFPQHLACQSSLNI